MTLAAHVDQLRTLAALDSDTTVLQVAMINVMAELAEAVDGLRGRLVEDDLDPYDNPPEPPHGFGAI
jgi:hypothetical protein